MRTRTWLTALLVALGLSAGGAGAQRPRPASPPLPGGHWAVRAAERAEALGLVSVWLPAQRSAPRAAVGAALREAAERAPAEAPHLESLARAWWERFAEEFPESDSAQSRVALLGSAARAGYESRAGIAAPSRGLFDRRTGIVPLPDESAVFGGATLAARAGSHLAAVAEPRVDEGGVSLPRWDLAGGVGRVALSVGEQPVGYGQGRGGGVVLTDVAPLRRVEVQTARPVRLPGWLGHLGPVSFHTFLTALREERHRGDPYFWGARAMIRPHPRLAFGFNRASIFGGDSIPTPVTPGNVGRMLLGILSERFENQIVAAEFRYRAPTEAVVPLTLYLEWGSEDAAGGWWDVPGRVFGVMAPAVPGWPQLSMGAEYAYFAPPDRTNPGWYGHATHSGGWSARDVPLGHPLGGEGSELLLYGGADLPGARLRVDGRAFRRERGRVGYDIAFLRAGNLFAPERAGVSHGVALDAAWRPSPRAEVGLSAFRDAGRGWSAEELSARVMVFF